MRKLVAAAAALALTFHAASAETTLGASICNTHFTGNPYTVISATANTNGLYIRTAVISTQTSPACLNLQPPGTTNLLEIVCASGNSAFAMVPEPLYVPAGWSVFGNNRGDLTTVSISYDLIGQAPVSVNQSGVAPCQ